MNLMKILIITNFVPYPPTSGAELRIYNLLRYISRKHDVSLISLFNPLSGEDSGAEHLYRYCTRIELVPRQARSRLEGWALLLKGFSKGEPRQNWRSYYDEMADKIRQLTEEQHYDIVQIHHSHLAPYVNAISSTNQSRKVLFLHNLDYIQYRRMMVFERNWRVKQKVFMNWLFAKQATLRYARRFDKCIAVSEIDRRTLKQAAPDLDIAVLPGGVDTKNYPLLSEPVDSSTLVFVGNMQYSPNVDAVIFFHQEIFPLIKQQVSDAKLMIVGRRPVKVVQSLASDDVIITGDVADVIPYYQQALVSIIPLRSGGGTRLKIPEAMSLGRPVVSTSLGCEGLIVKHGENILIADEPAEFAAQTVRLLTDELLRQKLITNGRQLVESIYDWQAVAQNLLQIYKGLV